MHANKKFLGAHPFPEHSQEAGDGPSTEGGGTGWQRNLACGAINHGGNEDRKAE